MSPFGGLFSYPYSYMVAPSAIAPALPTCSATSTLARNHCFRSPRPWLRFSPYQIPDSVTSSPTLPTTGMCGGSNSQPKLSNSGSRESSQVPDNHSHKSKAKQKTATPKNTVMGSVNELQNIHNMVRGLDKPLPP